MTAVNNVVLSYTGQGANYQVTIGVTKPERTMGNLISNITIPKLWYAAAGTAQGSSGTTMIVNLRRIERRFNVDGYLASGLGTNDSHWDASGKELDLVDMFSLGKALTMSWVGQVYNNAGTTTLVTLEKLNTERMINEGNSSGDGEAEYVVKFTAIQGEDIIK